MSKVGVNITMRKPREMADLSLWELIDSGLTAKEACMGPTKALHMPVTECSLIFSATPSSGTKMSPDT